LIAAAILIGLAIGALALVDRLRGRPEGLAPPHEPSQALMATPAPESSTPASSDQPVTPPPPPLVVNNETLPPPPQRASGVTPPSAPVTETARTDNNALLSGKAYMIQVGVFTSPANAQALQEQLKRAGIEARLETRVQLGPFKDKRDADKALARVKKLGINAVLVSAR
jgi:DedD protein